MSMATIAFLLVSTIVMGAIQGEKLTREDLENKTRQATDTIRALNTSHPEIERIDCVPGQGQYECLVYLCHQTLELQNATVGERAAVCGNRLDRYVIEPDRVVLFRGAP